MATELAVLEINLEPGKTFAGTFPRGAGLHVVDGTIWATTSGSLKDIWLRKGEEHQVVVGGGRTVLEAVSSRSTVALTPPADHDRSSILRALFGIAAVAMAALTMALLVILPAQTGPLGEPRAPAVFDAGTGMSPDQPRVQRTTQDSNARSSTQVSN